MYSHYGRLLRQLYEHTDRYTETELMHSMLETGAYILNSVHYYQKFKLKCELLHPLDLVLVSERLMRRRDWKK